MVLSPNLLGWAWDLLVAFIATSLADPVFWGGLYVGMGIATAGLWSIASILRGVERYERGRVPYGKAYQHD